MHREMEMVKEFMLANGHAINVPIEEQELPQHIEEALMDVRSYFEDAKMASAEAVRDSHEATRLNLIAEEAQELTDALLCGDSVAIADALADLAYVVIGTAITYDLPLPELIAEVHRSNMTKTFGGHKPVKGPQYSPPDLGRIIKEHSIKEHS